jgi:uroporphyrinogen III methyltransferase/synthase
MSGPGKVYLVGAGPGDPGLLTLCALDLIKKADVILFDQLVDERVREYFPEEAEKIFVGKEGSAHHVTQDQTIELIVEKAKAGRMVVRLKGGDPFVFGRGGEEAEACAGAGIPFEVVPGVTAGMAAPAYAGIPVTHRDASASLAFITGHRRGDKEGLTIPTPEADTLVYYMGIKNLPNVVEALVKAGRSPDTPVALIHRGTMPGQRTVSGKLSNIIEEAKDSGIRPPAIIVVGEVVKYREALSWYESRPLFGVNVLITRPRHQAEELRHLLEERGASVVSIPAIEIKEPADYSELDRTIKNLETYDYLVFTSVNGVTAFFKRLIELGYDSRAVAGLTTACIGTRTAKELNGFHVNCDLLPEKFVAESLLEVFPGDLTGKRVLIPRALEARDVLPEGLRERGAEVDVVPAYRTVGAEDVADVPEQVEIAVFTSSSTVDHFLKRARLPDGCKVASIGPVTADTLREHGLSVDIEAEEHTIPGLVHAIEKHVEKSKRIKK